MNSEQQSSAQEKPTAAAPTPSFEDRPAETQPAVSAPAVQTVPVKKESWATRASRWILVALLFLILGAAGVYFALTVPANQQVAALNQAAETSAAQIATLQADLKTAQSGLADATATVKSQSSQIDSLAQASAVYKMIADVDTMRVSLLRFDTITATQALTNARADVTALASLGIEKSTLDGFTTRLNNAAGTLSTNSQQSMIELDNLIDNLYLLATNLK